MLLAQEFAAPPIEWWHISPLHRPRVRRAAAARARRADAAWPRGGYAWLTALTAFVAGGLALFLWDDDQRRRPGHVAQRRARLRHPHPVRHDHHLRGDDAGRARHGRRPRTRPVATVPRSTRLMLVSATGGVVMASANDLIVLFLGLETLSLALYVLAASDRRRSESQEAGIKYFVLGGFASAFFLYGIALIYGGTQSTNISEIVRAFNSSVLVDGQDSLVLAGIALLDRRSRLQGRRRAVPRLDPRRLPGCADPCHGVHGVGRQGGSVRRHAARARDRAPVPPRRLAPCGLGAGGAVARDRFGAGGRADRRQAHAGVLVDQPRRLHPGRRRGRLASCGRDAARRRDAERHDCTCCCTRCSTVGTFAVVAVVARARTAATRRSTPSTASPPASRCSRSR